MNGPTYKILPEFPAYGIYPGGQVMRLDKGRNLKPCPNSNGYLNVTLMDVKGQRRCIGLAQLVARAFLPNPQGLPDVGYKDGNRAHVTLPNLYWTTGATTQRERPTAQKRNKTGLVGAVYVKTRGYWESTITRRGVKKHLGTFDTPEEAHQAYVNAKNNLPEV